MKTFAILSDLHGNQPALEAIKEDIIRFPVDQVIALGDYVTPFASPMENLKTLEDMGAIIMLGNNEERVIKLRAGEMEPLRGLQQWSALFFADEQTRNFDFKSLPYKKTIEAEGNRLALMHSTPDSTSEVAIPDEFVRRWIKNKEWGIERVNEVLRSIDADYWVSGHSHIGFVHSAYGKTAVNPGSAGLTLNRIQAPIEQIPPAPDFGSALLLDYIDSGKARYTPYTQYIRLKLDKNSNTVIFRTLPYDYRKTIEDIIMCGLASFNRAWSRLAVQELLTGWHTLMPFIECVISVQHEMGAQAAPNDIWDETERRFPFQIPPLV